MSNVPEKDQDVSTEETNDISVLPAGGGSTEQLQGLPEDVSPEKKGSESINDNFTSKENQEEVMIVDESSIENGSEQNETSIEEQKSSETPTEEVLSEEVDSKVEPTPENTTEAETHENDTSVTDNTELGEESIPNADLPVTEESEFTEVPIQEQESVPPDEKQEE